MSSSHLQLGSSGNPPKVHVPSDSPRGQQSVRALAGLTFSAHLPPCRSVHSVPQREGPILSPALAWLAVALGTSASLPEPAGWAPLARVASRHRSSAALASCRRQCHPPLPAVPSSSAGPCPPGWSHPRLLPWKRPRTPYSWERPSVFVRNICFTVEPSRCTVTLCVHTPVSRGVIVPTRAQWLCRCMGGRSGPACV